MLIAGLIDGLNPCAFATIVFLVSYLSFLGKQSKEILTYGLIFTSGVFIAYILAGMGLMAGFRQLSGFPMITKGIYLVIGTFAIVLGIISFYDYILFRRGQIAKMKLQLPMALKKKIHGIIRIQTRSPQSGFHRDIRSRIHHRSHGGGLHRPGVPPHHRIYHDSPRIEGECLFESRPLQHHVYHPPGGHFCGGLFRSDFGEDGTGDKRTYRDGQAFNGASVHWFGTVSFLF